MINKRRLVEISAKVLTLIVPGGEALDPVRGLQLKLHRKCDEADPLRLAEKLPELLVPKVEILRQSGFITENEAQEFTVTIMSEILGTSIGQRACE